MNLAVIFPGIGYHTDKPLLYYSKKLAGRYGFEITEAAYGNFPDGVKGSREKMHRAFESALMQAEQLLKEIDFGKYEKVLFISKSIGTAVAAAYARKKGIQAYNIYYTPVEESFLFMEQDGIVFHGTSDPWVGTETVKRECAKKNLPLFITEHANHSLETGNVTADLRNLEKIMEETERYIKGI